MLDVLTKASIKMTPEMHMPLRGLQVKRIAYKMSLEDEAKVLDAFAKQGFAVTNQYSDGFIFQTEFTRQNRLFKFLPSQKYVLTKMPFVQLLLEAEK